MLSGPIGRAAAVALIGAGIAVAPIPPGAAASGGDAAAPGGAPRIGAYSERPLPRFASLKTSPVNMRRGPGFAYAIEWELTRVGLPVRITSEFGHWRRVQLHTGEKGWIHRALLSHRRTAIFVDAPNGLRARPDDAAGYAARVGVLTPFALSSCKPKWCLAEIAGVTGWAARARLWGVDAAERF